MIASSAFLQIILYLRQSKILFSHHCLIVHTRIQDVLETFHQVNFMTKVDGLIVLGEVLFFPPPFSPSHYADMDIGVKRL